MSKSNKNQSGSVLLYSLLVISLITAISIIISIIVVNEIKLTSAASNGIQSYYAAESGIERGLHAMKIIRNDQSKTLDVAVTEISNYTGVNFENKASYDNLQTSSITSKVENVEVKENDYIQIDYYDINSPLIPVNEVVGITVRNSGNNPATWAEVSWTAWDDQGILGTDVDAKKYIGPSDLARPNGWPINDLDVFDIDFDTGFDGDPVGYRVRIKALKAIPTEIGDGDLSSLTVIPYDGTPPPLDPLSNEVADLPSQLVIKSIGERSNFKQSLTATVPWSLPLFGLYDYVLFSEGDILKDIILSSPTYSSGVIEIESSIDQADKCDVPGPMFCTVCSASHLWDALCPIGAPDVMCFGSNNSADVVPGQCKIMPEVGFELYGFTLPIPDSVPAGDEYYVSYRAYYDCSLPADCNGRNLAVELSGNSNIVNDQSVGIKDAWVSCTIPYTYSLGDPQLPEDDPTRIIKITNNGANWISGDSIRMDWYQLSTYKIFPDCE